MRSLLRFVLTALLAAQCVQAQSQAGQSQPDAGAQAAATASDLGYIPANGTSQDTEASAKTSDPNTPWLPITINGESPTVALAGELTRSNELRGGLTVTSGYDDNALAENGKPAGNASFSFMPSLSVEQSRIHTLFDLSYNPGFSANQASQLNTNTQAVNLNLQYRFTQYLTLRVHDVFSSSNNPYADATAGTDSVPGSVLHQPSEAVLTPFANRISNLGGVDLIYQLGPGAILGGSGTSDLLNYDNLAGGPGVQLIDSRSEGADLFYKHRVWYNQWIGVTYSYQRFTFSGGAEQTDTNTALLFYTIPVHSHLTLSVFGGAAYSVTNGQATIIPTVALPASSQQWLPNEGMTLSWQGEHTGISTTFSRSIAGGGGLFGTVDRYNGTVDIRQQFRPRWTGTLDLLYDNNRPIDFITSDEFRTLSAAVGLQHQIGEHLYFGFSYSRVHQVYGGLTAAQLFPDHNRTFLSISYLFNRPLGR